MGESLLKSDTFVDYVACIQNDYACPAFSSDAIPGIGGSDERVRYATFGESSRSLSLARWGPLLEEVSRRSKRSWPIGVSTCGLSGHRITVNFGTAPTVELKKTTPTH